MTQVDGERSRLLLAYLQQREEAAGTQLDDYLSELGEGVKETWLERGFSEDLLPDPALEPCLPRPRPRT
ncbi:hypothetical protein [Aeromonas dhakensis]|uniref:hypothetical protein n=1 Tax=Aeromonas dhakensis TaxID=196024 RepID=UPI003F4CC831